MPSALLVQRDGSDDTVKHWSKHPLLVSRVHPEVGRLQVVVVADVRPDRVVLSHEWPLAVNPNCSETLRACH